MKQSQNYHLRPAKPEDFAFAEALHINAMRPLMLLLNKWDEEMRRAAIRRSYKATDSQIISVAGEDIGWVQVTERDADLHLAQIQLAEEHCGHGIGSRIILEVLDRARREGKTVSLAAVRTNRAIGLYERFGFQTIDPEATPIIEMVWTP